MGEILLECDAEILRVIETMDLSARALGIEQFDTFIITNGIFVTATMEDRTLAKTKQIRTHDANLGKIEEVNLLSRKICGHLISVDEALEELERIRSFTVWSTPSRYLMSGIGCFSLAVIYGGTYRDGICSMLISFLVRFFLDKALSRQMNRVLVNLFASIGISLAAIGLTAVGAGQNVDKIIIGTIMLLVPGILLTNGIRDIVNNDYLSGIIRVIEAVLIASSIAVGVGAVFHFMG